MAKEKTTLVITRGYPSSGKSTAALAWVNEDPKKRVRVNRDEMRQAMFGVYHGLDYKQETMVTTAQQAAVRALLGTGKHVVVDDTNLTLKYARAWADLAVELGCEFRVVDVETDADECVRRNAARAADGGRSVPEDVIRGFAARFPLGRWPAVEPTPESVTTLWRSVLPQDRNLPRAWLFDLDGTMAHNDGHRSFYDYTRVSDDKPHEHVIDLYKMVSRSADLAVVMSGREGTEQCRTDSWEWVVRHGGYEPHALIMRARGDSRPDDVVKDELYEAYVRPHFYVVGVVDDRPKVNKMWRGKDLTTFQVGDPANEF